MARQGKESSKYKNVHKIIQKDGSIRWSAKLSRTEKYFDTEREAAICIDMSRINKGKEPYNILKRKV